MRPKLSLRCETCVNHCGFGASMRCFALLKLQSTLECDGGLSTEIEFPPWLYPLEYSIGGKHPLALLGSAEITGHSHAYKVSAPNVSEVGANIIWLSNMFHKLNFQILIIIIAKARPTARGFSMRNANELHMICRALVCVVLPRSSNRVGITSKAHRDTSSLLPESPSPQVRKPSTTLPHGIKSLHH